MYINATHIIITRHISYVAENVLVLSQHNILFLGDIHIIAIYQNNMLAHYMQMIHMGVFVKAASFNK